MRNIAITIFGMLWTAIVLQAQFSAGIKSGVLINDVHVESGAVNLNKLIHPITGYNIGAFSNYQLNEDWSLQGELLYKHSGFQISEGTSVDILGLDVPLGVTARTTVNYLEVPLLVQYKHRLGGITGYINAGPSLNYALNGHVKTVANSILDFNINTTHLNLSSDRYNRLGVAANIGAGIEYDTSDDIYVHANIRYTSDFSSQVEVPIIEAGVRNSSWALGLGVGRRF